jgi:hypothetical protein
MSLGEAFVEVHADLRPFARDLRQNTPPIVKEFERQLNGAVGRAMGTDTEKHGRDAGDKLSRGLKNSLTHQFKSKNAFIVIASTLAGALDDGISALPTEVKAAIVAGILAASPLVLGALGAAVSAALGVGLAGIGILLASQFESVQKRAVEFGRNVRTQLVEAATAFGPAIISALGTAETRISLMRGRLDQIFNTSSTFLEPLAQGVLDAIEKIIDAIAGSLDKIKPFIDELGAGIAILGDAIADAFTILLATGEDGQKAFRDLVGLVAVAIVSVASLVFVFAKLYGLLRNIIIAIANLAGPFTVVFGVLKRFFDEMDKRSNVSKSFINTNTDMEGSFTGLIKATDGETDALKEYRDAIEAASNAAKNQLELSIAWEESLDRISESLRKNGKTLDITTEKGRENATAFMNALKIAEDAAVQRVRRGEQTGEQAAASYDLEIAKLRELAHQAGVSDQKFNELFDQIILTGQLRISSTEVGVDDLAGALGIAGEEAKELYATLQLILNLRRSIGAGAVAGVRNFAAGGIHYMPEIIRVAEAGPEVTIPLTRPARAAQLLQESGLASSLAGGGPSQILVFVGNEQLDSRTVRIVERNNNVQARNLSQGPRRF